MPIFPTIASVKIEQIFVDELLNRRRVFSFGKAEFAQHLAYEAFS
jgi:hypothetical protein